MQRLGTVITVGQPSCSVVQITANSAVCRVSSVIIYVPASRHDVLNVRFISRISAEPPCPCFPARPPDHGIIAQIKLRRTYTPSTNCITFSVRYQLFLDQELISYCYSSCCSSWGDRIMMIMIIIIIIHWYYDCTLCVKIIIVIVIFILHTTVIVTVHVRIKILVSKKHINIQSQIDGQKLRKQ